MSIYDRQFQSLKVIEWSDETKTGVVKDAYGCTYKIGLQDLSEECDGCLFPGEEVEGYIDSATSVSSLQPADLCERKNFSSVGVDVQGRVPPADPRYGNDKPTWPGGPRAKI